MALEYSILREDGSSLGGPPSFSWEDTVIGLPNVAPLTGFRILCRPFEPPIGPQDPILYPQWRILNQTLISSNPTCGTIPFSNAQEDFNSEEYAEAGITDGSGYIYVRTFDQTRFSYLPAFSGGTQDTFTGEVEATNGFPETPYDPDNDIYPMDAITKFAPDQRPSVNITYTLTTQYTLIFGGIPSGPQGPIVGGIPIGEPITEIATISQTVLQPSFNWAGILFALQDRTYFEHGIYH